MPAATRLSRWRRIIVENLHFHDTRGARIEDDHHDETSRAPSNVVRIVHYRSNEFIKTGQGIMSAGEHTLITEILWMARVMHCGERLRSWGPMGICRHQQPMSYNAIKTSGPKIAMGLGWQLLSKSTVADITRRTSIFTMLIEGNAGFIESSWDYDWPPFRQEIYNWRVSFNVCYDGQSWLFLLAPMHWHLFR